ncbi:MFS transporter [Polychaeton citri CBS 116435]|uniref:Cercosporin MFS transporter CTB4 n=1 Tax=Polychaeton citri CBS 116435 TaxID=1314669 RepID=A0A9P4UPZ7_9PEZI|nr:MFS transporter [Polychaeton citri CBS 116435]
MQSVLQYRRFKSRLRVQLERDARKADLSEPECQPQPYPSVGTGAHGDDAALDVERDGAVERDLTAPHDHDSSSSTFQEEKEAEEEKDTSGGDSPSDDEGPELTALTTISHSVTENTRLGLSITGIEVRRRTTNEGGDGNVFIVGYEGSSDSMNPHNWSFATRIRCTFTVAAIGCIVGVASSIDSSAIPQAAREFGVSEVTESLATGLFLIGFGAGSLFAGPVSETLGRNPVYIGTMVLYMIFIMASGLAPNIGAQLAFRFIAGVFGSTPLTCAGGSISDMWSPLERVWAFPIFANAAFLGPVIGPVMGGFIAQSSLISWRWTEWITLIISGLVLAFVLLFQPETYPPILLKWKAAHLRELTGDERYRAEMEVIPESFPRRLRHALWRPFVLTAREPIIILIALYLTVVYIVLFTFLDGYTYIFQETYGISQGLTGACFLGIVVGLFGATALVPLIYKWAKRDMQVITEKGGDRLPPEFRLWFSMLGGAVAIPISLFWMGWTARPSISIWSPLVASVFFGYGILCVFISCYQYIIDSYETFAASALASLTLIRYVAAGGMTVVGIPFYKNLGVPYTMTILACLSALLVPVPYLFFKYGPWIRSKSKYAVRI